MAITLSYSEDSKGWPSFYSFIPEKMIGMNNYFYSFYRGKLWRHNVNETRNNYYDDQFNSTITSVFNVKPLEAKLWKTLSLESDSAWGAVVTTDLHQTGGDISSSYFVQKEGDWFAFIGDNASTVNFSLRSANGLSPSIAVTNPGTTTCVITLSEPPGNIISIGDSAYQTDTAVDPIPTPVRLGEVKGISNVLTGGFYSITIDNFTVPAGAPALPNALAANFIMYLKNSVAESHGIRGYVLEYKLTNISTAPVELFAVGSSIFKSYP